MSGFEIFLVVGLLYVIFN